MDSKEAGPLRQCGGGPGRGRRWTQGRACYLECRKTLHGHSVQCAMCTHTVLLNCIKNRYRLWKGLNSAITRACRELDPENGRVGLTLSNILYHITQPLSNCLPPFKRQVTVLLLELKRDIHVLRTERCVREEGGRIYVQIVHTV